MTDEKLLSVSSDGADEATAGQKEGSFLLDRIDALRVLRAETSDERDQLLVQLAGRGRAEQSIVDELSRPRPLARPEQFEESHRLVMRALEVLDRNGARAPRLPRLGPLKHIARVVVQQMTRWIVKSHQNTLVSRIRKLYERREASAVWGSREHHMLRRARITAAQVEAGLRARALGLPTFLVGGAFLTTIASSLWSLLRNALDSTVGVAIFAAILLAVLSSLAWAALFAASVARHRIRLSTDQPVAALWETIGAAGTPPRDQSYNFAVYAIILGTLALIVIPLALLLAVRAA